MVAVAVRRHNDEGLVGNGHADRADQVANADACVNYHRFFLSHQHKDTRALEFVNLPGILFELHHGVKPSFHVLFSSLFLSGLVPASILYQDKP